MPVVFPDHLPKPGGYASLGFLWQEGDSLPIGFSLKKIGYERIGITCAVCHTGAVQVPGEPRPRVYAGGVGNTLDLLAYQKFLFDCAQDERFNAATIMPEIARIKQLSWLDDLIYRWVLIPGTRKALLEQREQWAWAFESHRDAWGRGRIEPFNPVKRNVISVAVGSSLGTSDMQPLWNLDDVPNRAYHWDGLNTSLTEVVQSGALGDGATPQSIPLEYLEELEQWLRLRQAPKWPFQPPDPKLVARGSELFISERCANCHARKGALTGQVTPATEVGTDPNRAEMWTSEAARAYNDYLGNRPWKFQYFRSTGGYLNVPLDGIWARAPYLHNGSVPTLTDLLEPKVKRPQLFWRGLTDYDQEHGGFVSQDDKAQQMGSRYDTGLRGNGNGGHEYGTSLPAEDKQALVAYLKTL